MIDKDYDDLYVTEIGDDYEDDEFRDYVKDIDYLNIHMKNGDIYLPVYEESFDDDEMTWEKVCEELNSNGVYITKISNYKPTKESDSQGYLIELSNDFRFTIFERKIS